MNLTQPQKDLISALILKGVYDDGFEILAGAVSIAEFGDDPSYDVSCIASAIGRKHGVAILRFEFESFWSDCLMHQARCDAAEDAREDVHGLIAT